MKRFRLIVLLLVALLPAAITFVLVTWHLDAALTDFVPTFARPEFNDEAGYWLEISTFATADFHGGHFVYNDIPSPGGIVRYGAHGPLFPMLYGGLARLVGWELYYPPLFNLLLITLALGAFALVNRLNLSQLAALGLLTATLWPLLLFIPSCMQETFQQALALLLATAIFPVLATRERASRRTLIIATGTVILAALTRFTWALLLFPVLLIALKPPTWRQTAGIVAGVLVLVGTILVAVSQLTAPYPANFLRELSEAFDESIRAGIIKVMDHTWRSATRLNTGEWLEILMRYQVIAAIVIVDAVLVLRMLRGSRYANTRQRFWQTHGETLLHLGNLALILAVNLVLYDIFWWRDYRVFAAHLWLSALLLILRERYRLVWVLVISNVLFSLVFLNTYKTLREIQFHYPSEDIAAFETQVGQVMRYEEDLDPWCNTVLIDPPVYRTPDFVLLTGLPEGFGISTVVKPGPDLPLKSRYLLLLYPEIDPESTKGFALSPEFYAALNTRWLIDTPLGPLYENLDADCPPLELDSAAP